MEVVRRKILALQYAHQAIHSARRSFGPVLGNGHFAPQVVHRNDIAVEDVDHLRHFVDRRFGNPYTLEIGYTVISRVTEQSVDASFVSLYVEAGEEAVHPLAQRVCRVDRKLLYAAVRILFRDCVALEREPGDRLDADERIAVFRSVIVRTFEQCRFRKQVADFEVDTDRGLQVGEESAAFCLDADGLIRRGFIRFHLLYRLKSLT